MKTAFAILALTLFVVQAKAQYVRELHVGDPMPDIEIGKMIPVTAKSGRTADYEDKLLILDMWATNCASCIQNMPRLDSLQQEFSGSVRIIPVTSENSDAIARFWQTNRIARRISMPTVVEDTLLRQYFRYRFISHDVWIYKGRVIAITDVEHVNALNIHKILDGQPVNMPLKNDFMPHFDGTAQSLTDSDLTKPSNSIVKYAAIRGYKNGIRYSGIVNEDRAGVLRDPSTRSIRSFVVNQPVLDIYMWALLNSKGTKWEDVTNLIYGGFEPNRIVWEVTDRSKYFYEKGVLSYDDWLNKNGICYESLNPDTGQTDREVYLQIVRDMNDLLGLDVRFEKRKTKVLVLRSLRSLEALKTTHAGIDVSYHHFTEGNEFKIRDSQLADFVNAFNQYASNPLVIDETSYKSNIDMDLDVPSWTDIPEIRKQVRKYGLDLKEETRDTEMLVFTETGGGFKYKL